MKDRINQVKKELIESRKKGGEESRDKTMDERKKSKKEWIMSWKKDRKERRDKVKKERKDKRKIGLLWLYISHCRLFNAKSSLYIYILNFYDL